MIIYILLKRLKILLFLFPVFKWLLFTVLRSWQAVFKFGFFFPRIRRSFRILKGSEYTIFNCFWYFFLNCLRGKFITHLTLTSHVLLLLNVYNLKLETAYKIFSCFPFFRSFKIRNLRFIFSNIFCQVQYTSVALRGLTLSLRQKMFTFPLINII